MWSLRLKINVLYVVETPIYICMHEPIEEYHSAHNWRKLLSLRSLESRSIPKRVHLWSTTIVLSNNAKLECVFAHRAKNIITQSMKHITFQSKKRRILHLLYCVSHTVRLSQTRSVPFVNSRPHILYYINRKFSISALIT